MVSRPCGAASALVLEGTNGFLVEPLDLEGMTQALSRMITLDAGQREAMGMASREVISDWSPERFATGLKSAFHAALSCPPRPLAMSDEILFRALSHMQFNKVS
jgi:glycosyltransferase involved in cell wall biosynthesis